MLRLSMVLLAALSACASVPKNAVRHVGKSLRLQAHGSVQVYSEYSMPVLVRDAHQVIVRCGPPIEKSWKENREHSYGFSYVGVLLLEADREVTWYVWRDDEWPNDNLVIRVVR